MSINFLEISRLSNTTLVLKSIGETVQHQKTLSIKKLVQFMHLKVKQSIPLDEIYMCLKIT